MSLITILLLCPFSRILVRVVVLRCPTCRHPSDSFDASSRALRKSFLRGAIVVSFEMIWAVLQSMELGRWTFCHVPFIVMLFAFGHYCRYVWFFVIDAFIKGVCVGIWVRVDFLTFAQLREWLVGLDLVCMVSRVVLGPFWSVPACHTNLVVVWICAGTVLLFSAGNTFQSCSVSIMMLRQFRLNHSWRLSQFRTRVYCLSILRLDQLLVALL